MAKDTKHLGIALIIVSLAILSFLVFNLGPKLLTAAGIPRFDFSLSMTPTSGSATQGSFVNTSVTATRTGRNSQRVTFSCSGLPTGATCSFTPQRCYVSCTSDLKITTSSTTPAGTYNISVVGKHNQKVRKTTYTLNVISAVTPTPTPTPTPTSTPIPTPTPTPTPGVLFQDNFNRADGLVTNEYWYYNSTSSGAILSPDWEATNGSFFIKNQQGWTGIPDWREADATSSSTDSGEFRLVTKRSDFGNVNVSFNLTNNYLITEQSHQYDGVHIQLRYQSQYQLYLATINQRDGGIIIEKKCPGGSSNGGTYYDLGHKLGYPIPFNTVQKVAASVQNNTDGSVTLKLYRDGQLLLTVTDRGTGCAPITAPGRVGLRGDNDDFYFDDFTITAL